VPIAGLLPLLRKAGAVRVTTLSRGMATAGNIHFEDLQWGGIFISPRSFFDYRI